ncbi:MAG: PQQ-binding-like beta-propeller repeat protein, partial [Chthoniobacteraceae bacterium]
MPNYVFRSSRLLTALLAVSTVLPASADWLHYRGPGLDGVVAAKLPTALPSPPRVLWKAEVGVGTAAITVKDGRAFTMGNWDKKKDLIVCLDAKTGKTVWKHEYPLELDPNLFEGGPRSTPTLDGNLVFTVSHQGDLWALDGATGKKVWYRHYQKDFGGRRPDWGFAGSPTVAGELLLLDVGGADSSTVALNKANGEIVWKSGGDKPGYGSPVVANSGGVQTVVVFKAKDVVGLDLKTGRELWRTGWKTDYDVNAATPLISGNLVLVTSGYNAGAGCFQIGAGGKVTQKWKNKILRSHFNSPVIFENAIYGIDGNAGGGNLVCLDLATGAQMWIEKSVKGGSLVRAGNQLICLTEKGELVICDASPSGFKSSLRTKVLSKRCWVQPTGKWLAPLMGDL